MTFKIEKKKGHIILIHLTGRLAGEFQVVQLQDDLDALIDDEYYRIIFDLSKLEYMNSSGLSFFLKVLTKVRKHDGEVVLCTLNDMLETLIVTTKLGSFFTITRTVDEALDYLMKEKIK